MNKTARDGPFEVVVRTVACGTKDFTFHRARGEFCVLDVKVENRGSSADDISVPLWKLFIGTFRFPVSGWDGPGADVLFPGTSADARIAFDIPVGGDPTKVLVVGTTESEGVEIPL